MGAAGLAWCCRTLEDSSHSWMEPKSKQVTGTTLIASGGADLRRDKDANPKSGKAHFPTSPDRSCPLWDLVGRACNVRLHHRENACKSAAGREGKQRGRASWRRWRRWRRLGDAPRISIRPSTGPGPFLMGAGKIGRRAGEDLTGYSICSTHKVRVLQPMGLGDAQLGNYR